MPDSIERRCVKCNRFLYRLEAIALKDEAFFCLKIQVKCTKCKYLDVSIIDSEYARPIKIKNNN